MALIKGSGQKFAKRRTDVSTPAITQPRIVQAGFAMQGSADMDAFNPETFRFHVFGGVPDQTTMFIFGDLFNQNVYSEIPEHSHSDGSYITGNVDAGSTLHDHSGTVNVGSHGHTGSSSAGGSHNHSLYTGNDDGGNKIDIDGDAANNSYRQTFPDSGVTIVAFGGSHTHSITVNNTNIGSKTLSINDTSVNTHSHDVSGTSGTEGIAPSVGISRTDPSSPKTYFDDLQIEIDGIDRTVALLAQAGEAKFGDGTAGDTIVTTGFELDISAYILVPGEHKIVFSLVGNDNGGKVRYNLYTFAS